MLKLYEDKIQTFKCNLKIEGADVSKAKARMLLCGKTRDYIFNGKITKFGRCTISFPPITDFDTTKGKAVLEVIIENGYFEALKLEYEIVRQNIVEVLDIEMDDNKSKSVVVDSISIDSSIEDYIKEVKQIANEYKGLTKKDRRILREQVLKFNPSKDIRELTSNIFPNTNSFVSKLYMYYKSK